MNKIFDPVTGKYLNVNSENGSKVLQNYINQFNSTYMEGSSYSDNNDDDDDKLNLEIKRLNRIVKRQTNDIRKLKKTVNKIILALNPDAVNE